MTNEEIFAQARPHLANFPVGEAFGWAELLGTDWEAISEVRRPQAVGSLLGTHFSGGENPIIEFVTINRAPRYSIWRKVREVNVDV